MTDRANMLEGALPRGRRAAAGRALVVFFLVMAALTAANRALNELSTPIVTEARVQRGTLEKRVDADGLVKAASETPVFAPVKARVSAVHVRSGQNVKAGEPLFALDPEALSELKSAAKTELTKLKNDREKEAGSPEGAPGGEAVRQADEALRRARLDLESEKAEQEHAVSLKQSEADKASAKYLEAKAEYENAIKDARNEYLEDARDDLSEKEKALTEKRRAYDWAAADVSEWMMDKYQEYLEDVADAQAAYDKASGSLETAQAAYESAKGTSGESAAASALKKARNKAKEEKEDLDDAIRRRDRLSGVRDFLTSQRELENARADYAASDEAYQAAVSKTPETLREIERNASSEKSALDSAATALDEKSASLDAAKLDLGKAVTEATRDVEDADAELLKAQSELRGQELDAANSDAAIRDKQAEVDRLEAALGMNGVVSAPSAGQVTSCDIKPGKLASTDEAALLIGQPGEGMEVWIPVTEDEVDNIAVGDAAEIDVGGDAYECEVLSIAPSADDPGQFDVGFRLPDGAGQPGMTASMTVKKRTKNYEAIVPLSALRKDDTGYYVYVIVTADGALGAETRVQRADVQVLDRDSSRAAVSGGVVGRDSLAARSDRDLHDGDRVNVG